VAFDDQGKARQGAADRLTERRLRRRQQTPNTRRRSSFLLRRDEYHSCAVQPLQLSLATDNTNRRQPRRVIKISDSNNDIVVCDLKRSTKIVGHENDGQRRGMRVQIK